MTGSPRTQISRRQRVGLWLGLVAALATGCSEPEAPADEAAHIIVATPVAALDFTEAIRASGELEALDNATIAAEVGGRITERLLSEGDVVESGTIVLRIDPERRSLEVATARASVAEADAALQEARRGRARIENLRLGGAASEQALDAAKTAFDSAFSRARAAEARLGVAQRALADAEVRAPFTGIIVREHVGPGEYVQPGTPLFQLVATHVLDLVFHLSEADSGRVAVGNPVSLLVSSHPKERFGAVVTVVSPTIDPMSRTLRVKARVDDSDGKLRPGLFAHVELGVSQRSGVPMIPEEAVLQRTSGSVVFKLNDDRRVERVVVETGTHREGLVEIRSGLTANDWVVIQGQAGLVDDLVVVAQDIEGNPIDGRLAGKPAADVGGVQ